MAFRAYTLVLTGVAQRLSDVYGDGTSVINAAHDVPYRQVLLHIPDANANDVYIGASIAVSSTNCAFHFDQPSPNAQHSPVSLGPFSDAGPVKLSDLWALGTAGERLTIGGVPF